MAGVSSARAPWALLLAFGACLAYACFASGAADLPAQSWLQLALATIATVATAGWLYGNGLTIRTDRLAVAGLAALALFAAWNAVSIAYSVAPDRSWAQANTVFAYALTVVIGLLVGSSLPRAAERAGITIGAVAVLVATYALAAKALPGVLEPNDGALSRLRVPLGYWNALALLCATGVPPLLRAAAASHLRPPARIASLVGVYVLLQVLVMTISRGGILALIAGVVTLVALTTERVRTLVLLAAAALATVPPLAIALGREDLSTDFVAVRLRTDDGATLLIVALVCAALLAVVTRMLIALEAGDTFTPARGRAYGRRVAQGAAALAAVALLASVASGAVPRAVDDFTDVGKTAPATDPTRLVSNTSGFRWVWWREAAGAFSDRPIAGWGGGSFPVTHRLYRKNTLSVEQPHSVPLQWLAENGLVGFLLAAGGLGALLAAGLARLRTAQDRGAAAALLAIAVAWCAQAPFEWTWDIPAVTLPMLFALGVLAARPTLGGTGGPVGVRGPAMAAVSAAFVLYAVSVALPAVARTQVDSALRIAGAGTVSESRLERAAAKAELAARLNPLASDALVTAADIASRRGRLDDADRQLLRAVRRQPYDASAWAQLGLLQFVRGDFPALRRAADRALALDPNNPRYVGLAIRAYGGGLVMAGSASATGTPLQP